MAAKARLPALVLVLSATFAIGEPPRVVESFPEHADHPVDPSIKAIRITFDQEMNRGGRSICGGGETFPPFSEPPYWEDPRTFVIPVRLEADRLYSISINCPSARNFRSRTGEPAEIHPIVFKTGKPGERPISLSREDSVSLVEALRSAIDDYYSYRDLRVKDWEAVFDSFRPCMSEASTPAAFAREAVKLLSRAEDVHIGLVVHGMRLGTHLANVGSNFNQRIAAAAVPGYQPRNDRVAIGKFEDGITYILIGSWEHENGEEELRPVHEAIDAADQGSGVILDVRPNGGGDEVLARGVAGRFIDAPKVYSRNIIRNPKTPGGWDGPFDRVVRPSGKVYRGKVAVLIGPSCTSSNESFIKMMHDPPLHRLFGERTYGSSGRPVRHDLGHGLQVSLPSWQDMMPDGTLLEGRGIEPDRVVISKPNDASDRVIEAALDWLRGGEK